MPLPKKPVNAKANKQACEFVREHVVQNLVRAGWPQERAQAMADRVKDDEIQELLPQQKMQGLGDGKWLNFLKNTLPQLKEAVDTIVSLLSLFGDKSQSEAPSEMPKDEDEESEEEETDEDEGEEDE